MKTSTTNQNGEQVDKSHFARPSRQRVFTVTKKIAKHGKQAIIVVPKVLQNLLKPNTIVELKIKVLS